ARSSILAAVVRSHLQRTHPRRSRSFAIRVLQQRRPTAHHKHYTHTWGRLRRKAPPHTSAHSGDRSARTREVHIRRIAAPNASRARSPRRSTRSEERRVGRES